MSKAPVLFLDRDGTVNVDIGPEYVADPKQLRLIPGAARAILAAKAAGFRISIITNQAGVAKGKTPAEALPRIHRYLEELIAREGGAADFAFDDVRVCIHHPDDACGCRKPEVENLEASMRKLGCDVSRSFFIGDKDSDLLCAARVGMRSILVRTGHGVKTEEQFKKTPLDQLVSVEPSITEAVALAIRLSFK